MREGIEEGKKKVTLEGVYIEVKGLRKENKKLYEKIETLSWQVSMLIRMLKSTEKEVEKKETQEILENQETQETEKEQLIGESTIVPSVSASQLEKPKKEKVKQKEQIAQSKPTKTEKGSQKKEIPLRVSFSTRPLKQWIVLGSGNKSEPRKKPQPFSWKAVSTSTTSQAGNIDPTPAEVADEDKRRPRKPTVPQPASNMPVHERKTKRSKYSFPNRNKMRKKSIKTERFFSAIQPQTFTEEEMKNVQSGNNNMKRSQSAPSDLGSPRSRRSGK